MSAKTSKKYISKQLPDWNSYIKKKTDARVSLLSPNPHPMFTGRCEIDTAKIQHIFKYFAKKMQIFSKKQIIPAVVRGFLL